MQPYLLPYRGYFQLIRSVDIFVLYDTVKYINRGWINRNRLHNNGREFFFSVPIVAKDAGRLIKDVRIDPGQYNRFSTKFLKSIDHLYSKAPYFEEISDCLNILFDRSWSHIADLASESVCSICNELRLPTQIMRSSTLDEIEENLSAQERIISIVELLNGTTYVNMMGGSDLYQSKVFSQRNIELKSLESNRRKDMFGGVADHFFLSIVDLLMWSGEQKRHDLINDYVLFEGKSE
jgi:predicted XRE-type DNA-binding protein